jgi:hypothetical protein
MPMMTGLPGVRKKKIEAVYATGPYGFTRALENYRCATAAGDDGAVNAYIDDKGQYRAHFCRHYAVLAEGIFTSKAALRRWLKEQLPRMYEFHS